MEQQAAIEEARRRRQLAEQKGLEERAPKPIERSGGIRPEQIRPPVPLSQVSGPVPAAPAAQIHAVATVPLLEAVAACDKAAKNVPQFELPGTKESVRLDACYRGRDHLVCTMAALRAEAESLDKAYRSIVDPNYPNIKNIDAVCRIQPSQIEEHLTRSKEFDARWEVLRAHFLKATDCNTRTVEAIRNVSMPKLPHAAELMQSMINAIRNEIQGVSGDEKKVLKMAESISEAQGVMATIRQIRAGLCPQKDTRR